MRLALPRTQAEALLTAADEGLKVILALDLIRATQKLGNAVDKLGKSLQRRVGTVAADFDRLEASTLHRAADIGVRLHAPFALKWERAPAKSAIDKLQHNISAA